MRYWLLLLLLALPARADDLSSWGREFRELRQVKGWFSGGDRFIDAVDKWGGRKQELMGKLAEALKDHSVAEVEEVMGAPDEVAEPGGLLWSLVRVPCDRALIYLWRGHHDFLYFACRGNDVVGHRWWMAGE